MCSMTWQRCLPNGDWQSFCRAIHASASGRHCHLPQESYLARLLLRRYCSCLWFRMPGMDQEVKKLRCTRFHPEQIIPQEQQHRDAQNHDLVSESGHNPPIFWLLQLCKVTFFFFFDRCRNTWEFIHRTYYFIITMLLSEVNILYDITFSF